MTKLTDERIKELAEFRDELSGDSVEDFARAIEREAFAAGYRQGQEDMKVSEILKSDNAYTVLAIRDIPIKEWS